MRKNMRSHCADDTCCWRLQWSLGTTAQEEPVPDRQRHRLQSSWQQWWRRSSAGSAPQTCMPRRTAKTTAATCSGRSWRYPPSPSAVQCDSVQNSPLRRTAVSCWPSGAWTSPMQGNCLGCRWESATEAGRSSSPGQSRCSTAVRQSLPGRHPARHRSSTLHWTATQQMCQVSFALTNM